MGKRLLAIGLLSLAGCGEDDAPGVDAGLSSDVTGSRRMGYLDETGAVVASEPDDLTGWTFYALVGGGGAGYQEVSAPGRADGTFTIPNLPQGEHLFGYARPGDRPQSYYSESSARVHDSSWYALQRPTAVLPAPETYLRLEIAGLATWEDGDMLEVFAPSPGSIFWPNDAVGFPVGGEEALAMTVALWAAWPTSFAFDAAAGDRAWVVQLERRDAAAGSVLTPTRVFHTDPFSTPDGMETVVSGGFDVVPQDQTVPVNFALTQFEAQRAAVHPDATVASSDVHVGVFPAWEQYGVASGGWPDLMVYSLAAGAGDVDESIAYGDPFPGGWGRFIGYVTWFDVEFPPLEGEQTPIRRQAGIGLEIPLASVTGAPVTPVVTPIRDPRIGDADATLLQTGVGTTPVIRWDPPEIGGDSIRYQVSLQIRGWVVGPTRYSYTRATFWTSAPEIEVPPGILLPGYYYVGTITAASESGWATTVLAPFTP